MNILHEALSRTRMFKPRDEAHSAPAATREGARAVAMRSRSSESRELGDLSQRTFR